jgi:hypothetical protein
MTITDASSPTTTEQKMLPSPTVFAIAFFSSDPDASLSAAQREHAQRTVRKKKSSRDLRDVFQQDGVRSRAASASSIFAPLEEGETPSCKHHLFEWFL